MSLLQSLNNMLHVLLAVIVTVRAWADTPPPQLDNGVISIPNVKCMEDQVKLTFKTQRPFHGRIFVKGMSDKESCVSKYVRNTKTEVAFELHNGDCNMRRTRVLGNERRGMEQSITVIISFHSTFITKVDKAYRCKCFYMEADEMVSSKFDVSVLPTSDVIDTARMPICTYTVRRDSIIGPLVQYAKIGDPVYHVWQCESDMFSMLVHSCFVDDSNGQERKAFIDEHGCAIDPVIVPDLNYNKENNLAYSQVNVFSFADKITTYFQCALTTCMIADGMCEGKTPPRCGPISKHSRLVRSITDVHNNSLSSWIHLDNTIDVSAQKITVLDLEETLSGQGSNPRYLTSTSMTYDIPAAVCMSSKVAAIFTVSAAVWTVITTLLLLCLVLKYKRRSKAIA